MSCICTMHLPKSIAQAAINSTFYACLLLTIDSPTNFQKHPSQEFYIRNAKNGCNTEILTQEWWVGPQTPCVQITKVTWTQPG